jgi:hypothetical protein
MARDLVDLPTSLTLPGGVEIREAVEKSEINELHEFTAWRWRAPIEYHRQLKAMIENFRIVEPGSKTCMWLAWRDGLPIVKIVYILAKDLQESMVLLPNQKHAG